ncbi:MAG TPA: ATP-binding cassette domain-containing protein, partial [Reyranella sp.]|nr:ATP-binding cassette domain-containing protein [Reyranella sp.]
MSALLEVDGVSRLYSSGSLLARRQIAAVDGVSLRLDEGKPEIVTVIGESGSGKTTLARMVLNMVPPSAGTIRFRGTDLREVRGTRARLDFMRQVQPIFQNPFEAFNPMKRVDRYLFATARHMAGLTTPAAIEAEADRALRDVGLSLAEVRRRYPH